MLWAALCLLLLPIVASQNPICQIFTVATEEKFILLNLVGLAQYLPNSTEAELGGLLDEAKALGNTCCSAAPTADCLDDVSVLFTRAVCTVESLKEKNHLKACCEKVGDERIACFRHQKAEIARDHKSDFPTENCTVFKEDGKAYFKSYVYSFAKLHPLVAPQVILNVAKRYISLMTSCCDSNETQTCLDTKKAVFHAGVKKQLTKLRVICIIQEKYGDSVVMDKITVEYNHNFPEFSVAEIAPWVEKMVAAIAPCCHGDMVACMRTRKELIDDLCNNVNTLRSPSLAQCCKLDVTSRGGCISNLKHDHKLDDPLEHYDLQDHIKDVCESFTASARHAITNLLAELSRHHPEASQGVLLRYVRAAEQALTKCCASEHYAECVKTTMSGVDLEKSITDAIAKYNHTRDTMAAWGCLAFEESLFFKYARNMPQATFDQLLHLTKAVADTYKECLRPDHKPLACEDELTNIIDEMCHNYHTASINSQVDNCCNQSYSSRLPCIMSMTPDTHFHSADPIDTTAFPMGPVLCSRKDKELAVPHKKLLYGLARLKTNITDGEFSNVWDLFNTTRTMCCSKEDQEACFRDGAPALIILATTLLLNKDH